MCEVDPVHCQGDCVLRFPSLSLGLSLHYDLSRGWKVSLGNVFRRKSLRMSVGSVFRKSAENVLRPACIWMSLGIVYNIQSVINYHIPTWFFAVASGSAALFRIGRLVEENRELLKRHYVVSKMLKNFELLPGFSLLTIGKNVDQISVLNGKIIEEYYKGRVSDTSVELLG